jgi:peptidyl-prolyl cis-trans isomerase SurA
MRVFVFLFTVALALSVFLSAARNAQAQSVQRIAAIVNDEVISGFDIEQRTLLIIASTRSEDNPQARQRFRNQVLQQLIDERLQMQEAQRYGVRVQESEITRAIARIERQNNMVEGGVGRLMQQRGIAPTTLEQQLRAEIAWTKLVSRRLRPQIKIGDDEVEEVYQDFKRNAGKTEHNISEIFVRVNDAADAAVARETAEKLADDVRRGANFANLARQFSANATAARGGNIGWVRPGQLNNDLEVVVVGMREGEISQPIRSGDGYYIIKLHKRRKILEADPGTTKLTLKRLLLPLAPGAGETEAKTQSELASTVAGSVRGCDQIEKVAKELRTTEFGDLGTVLLGNMPANIRRVLADLPVGAFSRPIRSEEGILLLMICDKVEPKAANITRKQVEQSLIEKRLSVMRQRYIRDLRRLAVVEMR